MFRAHLAAFAFCVLVPSFPAVVTAGEAIGLKTLWRNPDAYEKHWILVRGYVAMDELEHRWLFETLPEIYEEKYVNYGNAIDLDAFPGSERSFSLLRNAACVELYGRFESYTQVITIDYLLSKAGLLHVKRVATCSSR
jgi:hypothetical protein